MKSKIVIFKVLAAIVAVGGALASVSANSLLAVTTVYIRYQTATNHGTFCTTVGTCNTPGNNPCQVTVTIDGTPIVVNPKKKTGSACSTATVVVTTTTTSGGLSPKTLPDGSIIL